MQNSMWTKGLVIGIIGLFFAVNLSTINLIEHVKADPGYVIYDDMELGSLS